ncbi:hypothetical protein [Alkalicoccobacillus plakortidis]|uniref:Uncharacterized protein n=1 Tax=Alkalicoccobacillus plakortidis TaxID=444060 RepID=A0ABT0XI11_9BACI|nr:hypothetical protein [Alkalicoccobacillus plakortidis]MCM2675533.1 hypothetical protein [Alkalicoccobacillus plakortidis]
MVQKKIVDDIDNIDDFDDVPAGGTISDEHLLYYLKQGREIEFMYNKIEYFICHSVEGRAVWSGTVRLTDHYDDRNEEFINTATIEGVTVAEIFKNKQAEITTIF